MTKSCVMSLTSLVQRENAWSILISCGELWNVLDVTRCDACKWTCKKQGNMYWFVCNKYIFCLVYPKSKITSIPFGWNKRTNPDSSDLFSNYDLSKNLPAMSYLFWKTISRRNFPQSLTVTACLSVFSVNILPVSFFLRDKTNERSIQTG